MTRRTVLATIALGLALVGCPGPEDTEDTDLPDPFDAYADADLTDPEVVVEFAKNVSAPNMYMLSVLFGAALENGDGICPSRSETDGVITYTGGCTDADGDVWVGSATVTQTSESSGTIVYDGLGRTSQDECTSGGTVTNRQVFDGSVVIEADGSFDAEMSGTGTNVDEDACTATEASFRLEYAGQLVEQSETVEVWSGSGRFGTSDRGKVGASTANEVLDDDGCNYEAESGTTTMQSGGDTVVITYDGASDCDPESTVTWTLNGSAMGELSGIQCGAGLAASALAAAFAGLLVLGRRRRRD